MLMCLLVPVLEIGVLNGVLGIGPGVEIEKDDAIGKGVSGCLSSRWAALWAGVPGGSLASIL